MSSPQDIYPIKPFTYSVAGEVIHGDKVGRTIGFPTANLKIQSGALTLEPGVYLATATFAFGDKKIQKAGLAYYGPRHIFGELRNSFEVFLYDFDQEIYGVIMSVDLTHFMRPPLELGSLEALKNQLELDKNKGLELLKS